jgi:hypothetical protein
MDVLLLQTIQTRSGANSAFCSLGTVGSSPETRAASVQLITDLHLAMRYRMNAAILVSPLRHMPSWCTREQLYVYCFTFADLRPSSQFQCHTSSPQQLTWYLCATVYRWGLALWRNNSVKVDDIFFLLWCCSLTTHDIWHEQALTGDSRKSVQSLSIVDPRCGPQFLRHFTCKDSSDCRGHKNPVGILIELYKLALISSGEAEVKIPHLAALMNYCIH